MAQKAFSSLKSAEEIRKYLDKPLWHMRHSVFHYTSLKSLLEIFKGGKLKFSRFDRTNDKIEADFVSEETKKKFFFCLMRTMEENFGMWAMYGGLTKERRDSLLEDICVKIEFDVKNLRSLIKEKNLSATTVAYTQIVGMEMDKGHIFFCGSCKNTNGIQLDGDGKILSGYIKDIAWKYEKEMRLWSRTEYVDLPCEFLKSLKIIPSPVSSVAECKSAIKKSEYKNLLGEIESLFVENKYNGLYLPK